MRNDSSLKWLSDNGLVDSAAQPPLEPTDDSHMLDAYSRAVVDVVGRLEPSVVSIRAATNGRRGQQRTDARERCSYTK